MAEYKHDDPVMQDALDRFEESQDGTDFNRETAKTCIEFARLGEQWPDDIRATRESEGRPCMTINKLPSFIRQVVNEARQNKPAITVSPVDSSGDEKTAHVISGLIRHIERNSSADVAYDTALDNSATGGIGFLQVGIDYINDSSFDMECQIHRIFDPLSVYWDPASERFDSADWRYCFVSEFIKEDEFKARYPKAKLTSFEGGTLKELPDWYDNDYIRIAAYWTRDLQTKTLLGLSDGQTILEEQIPGILQAAGIDEDGEAAIRAYLQLMGLQVTRTRKVESYSVTKRMISGCEVLSEEPWPGSTIPVVPVWGEEVVSDGKRHFRSMIADAIGPQTLFNFMRSAEAEIVSTQPRNPWVGPKGFIPTNDKDYQKWMTAHNRTHAFLEYEGQIPPQRQPNPSIPTGVIQAALNAADDIKSTTGIFDSSLGAQSNETSGKAILARQRESDVSNFHFIDNLNRAIECVGRILVEVIPHVYGPRQAIRILGEDQKEEVIQLVQEGQKANQAGQNKLYDLSAGRYDVSVKSGPSYASQREETREVLIEIMRSVPGAGQVIGDIVMEHLDFQGADRVARRLKMTLPEEMRKAEAEEMNEDMPEEVQAILQQANAEIAALKQALAQAQNENMPEIERMNLEKAKFEIEKEIKQKELEIKQAELELKRSELDHKHLQEIIGEGGEEDDSEEDSDLEEIDKIFKSTSILDAINRATAQSMAPVRIMRDENGKIIGSEREEIELPDFSMMAEGLDLESAISSAAGNLALAQSMPTELVRDENDRVIGARKVQKMEAKDG